MNPSTLVATVNLGDDNHFINCYINYQCHYIVNDEPLELITSLSLPFYCLWRVAGDNIVIIIVIIFSLTSRWCWHQYCYILKEVDIIIVILVILLCYYSLRNLKLIVIHCLRCSLHENASLVSSCFAVLD